MLTQFTDAYMQHKGENELMLCFNEMKEIK